MFRVFEDARDPRCADVAGRSDISVMGWLSFGGEVGQDIPLTLGRALALLTLGRALASSPLTLGWALDMKALGTHGRIVHWRHPAITSRHEQRDSNSQPLQKLFLGCNRRRFSIEF